MQAAAAKQIVIAGATSAAAPAPSPPKNAFRLSLTSRPRLSAAVRTAPRDDARTRHFWIVLLLSQLYVFPFATCDPVPQNSYRRLNCITRGSVSWAEYLPKTADRLRVKYS